MGLRPPSLYAAFGSKEQLFREAVDFYVRTDGDGLWNHVPDAPSARAAVERLLRLSADAFTRRDRPRGCMIVLSAPETESDHPAVCEDLKRRRQENVAVLEKRLLRAVRDGELPAHADCRALAHYVSTVQHGMSIQARDGASRKGLHAVVDCTMAGWDALTSDGN